MHFNFTFKTKDDVSLKQTFGCGQCFRFTKRGDAYTGVFDNMVISFEIKKNERLCHFSNKNRTYNYFSNNDTSVNQNFPEKNPTTNLIIANVITSEKNIHTSNNEYKEILKNKIETFFDLNTNYTQIKNEISRSNPIIEIAVTKGSGIRILRQNLFETLISFIISQNNNIKRITKNIEDLCLKYGKLICKLDKKEYYSFPSPLALANADLSDLSALKLGYRAKYIKASSEQYLKKGSCLNSIINRYNKSKKASTIFNINKIDNTASKGIKTNTIISDTSSLQNSEANIKLERQLYDELTSFTGVGPKVADCIMLFATPFRDRFPLDTWMKKLMKKYYNLPSDTKDEIAKLNDFVKNEFSPHAGIAQQYLFYSINSNL